MRLFPQIRQVAAAITNSPRMVGVLAAAWHFAERLNAPLLLIHAGASHAQKQAEFLDRTNPGNRGLVPKMTADVAIAFFVSKRRSTDL